MKLSIMDDIKVAPGSEREFERPVKRDVAVNKRSLLATLLRRRKMRVVSNLDEASRAVDEGDKVVLAGQSVYLGFSIEESPGYVEARTFLARGDAKKVVRLMDLGIIQELYDTPVAFGVDGYIAYGRRFTHDTVVILGGAETEESVNLEIYVFENGVLKALAERNLPVSSSPHFESVFNATLQEFYAKFPITRIFMASGLPAIENLDKKIEYIGEAPFKRLIFLPGRMFGAKGVKLRRARPRSAIREMLVPITITVIGLVSAVALGVTGYSSYQSAVDQFKMINESPITRSAGAVNKDLLEVMKARKLRLDSAAAHQAQISSISQLIRTLSALPDLKMESIATISSGNAQAASSASGRQRSSRRSSGSSNEVAESTNTKTIAVAKLEISARAEGESSLEQASLIAEQIALHSGLDVMLDNTGAGDDKGGVRKWSMLVLRKLSEKELAERSAQMSPQNNIRRGPTGRTGRPSIRRS